MDQQKSAADRIRPILQAMDRTIDSLRRTRTNRPAPAAAAPTLGTPAFTPSVPAPPSASSVIGSSSNPSLAPAPAAGAPGGGPARLKARPKRLDSPFLQPFNQPNYTVAGQLTPPTPRTSEILPGSRRSAG